MVARGHGAENWPNTIQPSSAQKIFRLAQTLAAVVREAGNRSTDFHRKGKCLKQEHTTKPTVSFVIASHNYARFIGKTLKSILDQTVQDFEIIVVDDASSDGSCDVIRSIADPRIHLYMNDKNEGVASTYSKGISLATGRYINWLASDDWIEPRKIELQLEFFKQNPDVDILGAYLNFVDVDGNRHEFADQYQAFFNQPHDFNDIETWVGEHKLTVPSVMMRRSVFDRIGPRDSSMAVASDFEFWTRAYVQGCRFAMLGIPLATHRIHENSVGRRDRATTFLNMIYVVQKNILPAIEAKQAFHLLPVIFDWIVTHAQFGILQEDQRCRLLALIMSGPPCSDCAAFMERILRDCDPALTSLGRRTYATLCLNFFYDAPPSRRGETQGVRTDRLKQLQRLPDLLRESEADRAARLEQINQLTKMLRESELDRTARFDQITQLTHMVRQLEAGRADLSHKGIE